MPEVRRYNVLFLCTGNSARSIMAEAIMRKKGFPNFVAYSAGNHPAGFVRTEALAQIERAKLSVEGLRSKSWDEFAKQDSPKMDFVFTLSETVAQDVSPLWPGQPRIAHWGVPDPVAAQGTSEEIQCAYFQAFSVLDRRIGLFLCLPPTSLDTTAFQREIDNIGKQ